MTPPTGAAFEFGVQSHTGKVREENQDRMTQFTSPPFGEVFIVADGMGGHSGGATAATAVVQGMQTYLTSPSAALLSLPDALREACQHVNTDVYRQGNSGDPTVAGMGSTVVVAVFAGAQVVVAHVGDSRAYLFRDNQLQQITRDHTRVQQYIDANMMSEAEARNHPEASFLTQAIGQKPEVRVDVQEPLGLRPGDGILLCSDGLSGYIDNAVIEASLRLHRQAKVAVDDLVRLALEAGGEDNVTVQFILPYGPAPIMAMAPPSAPMSASAPGPASPAVRSRSTLVLTSLAIVLAVGAAAALVNRGRLKKPAPPVQQLVISADPPPRSADPAPAKTLPPPAPAPPPTVAQSSPVAGAPKASTGTVETYDPHPAGGEPVSAPTSPVGVKPVAPDTDPNTPKALPRIIVLADRKHRDAANKLKEDIIALLGGASASFTEVAETADNAILGKDTVIYFNSSKGHPVKDMIASKFGWHMTPFRNRLTAQYPSSDVVVVIGTRERQ